MSLRAFSDMDAFSFGANCVELSVYRSAVSTNERGQRLEAWSLSHVVPRVDLQPVSGDKRQLAEGSRESVKYQCFVNSASVDLRNGDRVLNPNATVPSTTPSLEVTQFQSYPARDGLPGFSQFSLRTVVQS